MKHENHTTQFDTKSYSVQNDKPKSAHNKAHKGHFCATLQNFIDRHIVDLKMYKGIRKKKKEKREFTCCQINSN